MTTKTRSTRTATKAAAAAGPAPTAELTVSMPAGDTAPAPHALSDAELKLLSGDAGQGDGHVDGQAAAAMGPAPTMAPPQAAGGLTSAGLPTSAGTPITGQKVVATYAEQSNRNAWAYLQTAGWKKLSDLTDTGSTTMTLLAAHARATGSAPYVDESPAGTIGTLYVW